MIKIGVVGIGNMGTSHARNLFEGKVKGACLTAVCDINPERLIYSESAFKDVLTYGDYSEMLASDKVDAVIIATPHYDHPSMGVAALGANKHALVEKPVGVFTKDVEELNKLADQSDCIFTVMYNQRTNPIYQKVRQMVQEGVLGELTRVHWVCTDWFRSEAYYGSGGWRATWKGEGGGVLLNQCPHQLDLLQWICGMPSRVRAFMGFGKYHDIEVEDDVTAYFEYDNGATGLFVTSTGEAPGVNRLEISGTQGRLQVENNQIVFFKNETCMKAFSKSTEEGFAKPNVWECKIPVKGEETMHVGIMQEFVDAINGKENQLSPGTEGINGLSLSNAMHLSEWTNEWVELPIDADRFKDELMLRVSNSKLKKIKSKVLNVEGSH